MFSVNKNPWGQVEFRSSSNPTEEVALMQIPIKVLRAPIHGFGTFGDVDGNLYAIQGYRSDKDGNPHVLCAPYAEAAWTFDTSSTPTCGSVKYLWRPIEVTP